RQAYQEYGYTGLFDQRRGKRSIHRVPMETAEKVLALYQERYFDLSVRHFHEKLRDEHSLRLSYSWAKQALQGAGLVARRKRRGSHRRRRPRRPMAGMLLHIDGSKHRWFQDDRYYDLIVILDDANSEIYYAQLVEEESTRTVMAALREVVEKQGLFCALYSDRGSHFFHTPKAGERVDHHRLTQVGRAMRALGIQMIPAYSPQARGRCERTFGTWQNRLPQELRLAGIGSLAEANRFLRERYMAEFNRQFAQPAQLRGTAFRRCGRKDLDWVFSIQTERVVAQDNTVAIGDRWWQIEKCRWRHSLAGQTVVVHDHLDATVTIRYGPHVVGRFEGSGAALRAATRQERGGKGGSVEAGGNQKTVPTVSPTPLEISPTARDSHFPTAPATGSASKTKPKTKAAHAA
ncbi:MAG: ISNCY family transposase, partial [Acidobacteriia bacterium]|nr:ISNCY family transposase [Terriglobia bacterium]